MIHICFPLYDPDGTYSKMDGTAICSVLEHTSENVIIHLLCDDTLTPENRFKFEKLVKKYEAKIEFHKVEVDAKFADQPILQIITIGTLQRLYIPQLIDSDKVIYFDADLIINLDVKTIWDIDLADNAIAACHDDALFEGWRKYEYIENHFFNREKYFNGGVLVMNLKKIREEYSLLEQVSDFFQNYKECEYADQDAMNYIFSDRVMILPQKFNLFVSGRRRTQDAELKEAIYHYSGEDGKPRFMKRDIYDELFFKYLDKTPWSTDENRANFYEKKLDNKDMEIFLLQSSLKKIFSGRKFFWGTSGLIHFAVMEFFGVNKDIDIYIDNNSALWGKEKDGIQIYSPEYIQTQKKDEFSIIITSMRYNTIKKQLISMGYQENIDFFDGRKFIKEKEGGYVQWLV